MSEVKWIKLVTDIFDNRKIKQIEKMPEGDSIIVIWVKLLCLAGRTNDNGLVYLTKEIPYTEDMLATEFNRPLQTVRLALTVFERFGMVEVIDDIYHVSSWEKYQNVEGLDKIREQTRARVARHREKEKLKLIPAGTACQYCGGVATGFDHIIATARGGADTEDNKVPCCLECNRIKNDKPLLWFLNANRDRIRDDIVLSNAKLSRLVTLSNVTNRYEVTRSNAIDIDIDKEKDIEEDKEKKEKEKSRKQPAAAVNVQIAESGLSPEVQEALYEFVKMRKLIKSPMTDRALTLMIGKLTGMTADPEEQLAILNQSIENSWKGIFPLRSDASRAKATAEQERSSYNDMLRRWAEG